MLNNLLKCTVLFMLFLLGEPAACQTIKSRFNTEEANCIPFEIPATGILAPCVRVTINGVASWAIVDTATSKSYIPDIHRNYFRLNNLEFKESTINSIKSKLEFSTGNKIIMSGVTQNDNIEMHDEIRVIPKKMGWFKTVMKNGEEVKAILSIGNAIRISRLQFDYLDRQIRFLFYDRQISNTDYSSCIRTTCSITDGLPYIEINNTYKAKFNVLFDTGASETLLPRDFDPIAYDKTKEFSQDKIIGSTIPVKKSDVTIRIGVTELHIYASLTNSKVAYSGIGYDFLKNKVITFDHRYGYIYFEWENMPISQ
jgi:hypothetical protein